MNNTRLDHVCLCAVKLIQERDIRNDDPFFQIPKYKNNCLSCEGRQIDCKIGSYLPSLKQYTPKKQEF